MLKIKRKRDITNIIEEKTENDNNDNNDNNKKKKIENNNEYKEKPISLIIGNEIKLYNTFETKLNKAKKLFEEFQKESKNNNKFKIMESIIDLIEINSTYNYEFLKLNKIIGDYVTVDSSKNEEIKQTYNDNLDSLKYTLIPKNFKEIIGKEPLNPLIELNNLFNLILLKFEKKEKIKKVKSKQQTIKIKNEIEHLNSKINEFFEKAGNKIDYNFPLIYASERVRLYYYQYLCCTDINSLNIRENNIIFFRDYIKYFNKDFKNIELDSSTFNVKLYLFILCLTDLLDTVLEAKKKYIKYQFCKNFEPYEGIYKNSSYIFKDKENKNIYIKLKDRNSIILHNDFEIKEIDINKYNINTLICDFSYYLNYPIKYLLKRNESMDYYFKKNKNYIEEIGLYDDFKQYLLTFISSNCVKSALLKSGKHQNIINLIEQGVIIKIINSKFTAFTPTYHFLFQGFTNKDILISLISNYPYILESPIKINNKRIYENFFCVLLLFS